MLSALITQIAASARANRVCGAAAATARASSIVSTSRSSGCSWTRNPSSLSRARCLIQVDSQLIGTPVKAPGDVLAEPDAPVAAVERRAEHRVDVGLGQRAHSVEQQPRRQLGRVHADEQRRRLDVVKRRREPLAESGAALRDQLESLAPPAPRVALEHEHLARRRSARDDIERVEQGRPRQLGRLRRAARRRQSRLRAARERFLGDHEQRDGFHASKLIRCRLQKTKA